MTQSSKHKRGFFGSILAAALLLAGIALCTVYMDPHTDATESNTQQAQDASSTPGQDTGAAWVGTASPAVPVALPGASQGCTYYRAETLESWRFISEESCEEYALTVLEHVQAAHYEFVQAGFLDLSGQSWGCVFVGEDGASVSVTLLPEQPFSTRSSSNKLTVTIIRYLTVEGLS